MLLLTVLSPHRDDAAFSLCLALSRWSRLGLRIRIVNFFTVSSYAPYSSASETFEISQIREAEDQEALALIHPAIHVDSLGLLDAPLRLNIAPSSISAPENVDLQPKGETGALASLIDRYLTRDLVLVPLALGDHIDHQAVRRAATSLRDPERLGFYEDLPYATWTSDEQLARRVQEIEGVTGIPLEPRVIAAGRAVQSKLGVVSRYASQITTLDAAAIADHSSRYGGGERIWLPKGSKPWRSLIE